MISKRNKRGILILSIITLIIILTPRILIYLERKSEILITSDAINLTTEDSSSFKPYYKNKFNTSSFTLKSKYKRPITKFNPNTYTVKDWMLLGLSNKQSNIIVKFIHAQAKSNKDLEKIYVLPKELFNLIKDSTFYPIDFIKEKDKEHLKVPVLLVELNSADEIQLTKINGIGSFFAKQIIKRRDMLGGFHQKTQLLEVWKLDSAVYYKIENQIKIDETFITKFDLNNVNAKELQSHPYINWNIANSIVQLRKQKGKYLKIDEIKESKLIDESIYNKIKPYLIVK